jgi:hypothetical protein
MLKRISLGALALVIAALIGAPAAALAASGPVGVWKLDEGGGATAADGSGNGNNGVLSGGATWVPGVFGGAIALDGSTGEIKVSDNNALEPATAVTVSAWVKAAGSPGTYRYIVAKGGNQCIAASYGLYTSLNGGLEFYISQHHGITYALSPDAGQGVWDGNWHLAVGTFDGTTIRLYIDGVQVGSGTPQTGTLEYLLQSSNDFYIGNYPSCQPHHFQGDIDEVAVWSRALGSAEISALASAGTGSGGSGTGGGGTQAGTGPTTTTGSGSGSGSGTPTTTKLKDPPPSVHGLKLSSSTVTVDARGHVAFSALAGLSISYTESKAATLTVTLLRSQSGVRRGERCVKPTGQTRQLRRCTRFVVVKSFVHTDSAGRLTLHLNQLLHGRLSPGTYRLDVTPRANGKVGTTVRARFVVRRAHR